MSPILSSDLYRDVESFRRRRVVWLLVSVSLLIGGLLAVRQLPLVSDRRPGRLETAIARRLVLLSIPRAARERSNPLSANADAWRDGAEHFQDHCALCHGRDGRGSGLARAMYPPVPDLGDPAIQRMSDGALFAIIQNGVRWTGMPAFRQEHSAEETWRLVSFIRRVPTLAPSDLAPATAHEMVGESQHRHDSMTAAHGTRTIRIDGTAFTPAEITVGVGDTVTWVNDDPFPHNVTALHREFRSSDLPPETHWTFTAKRTGRFDYHCTLHPGMHGTLVVEDKPNNKEP